MNIFHDAFHHVYRCLTDNIDKTKASIFAMRAMQTKRQLYYDEKSVEYVTTFIYLDLDLHKTKGFGYAAVGL
jgi:hypothetical protein